MLHATHCAICGIEGNATELYPATFSEEAFNPIIFSARRLPDRVHYRIVKCNVCGLVRSDPIADPEVLAQLYAKSRLDYDKELINLKHTYGGYLTRLADYGAQKGALLEIGCGNGFFLEEALAQGYADVRGVEPGEMAMAKASPEVCDKIVCDVMRPGLFEAGQFDTVCMFQVFDHISNPGEVLDECLRVLKPGGLVLCLNHDVGAPSARLMGERSPIIDIEHTYLYSRATIARIFEMHGFEAVRAGPVYNAYSLHYLMRLMPLPRSPKQVVLDWLESSPVGRIRMTVPLGNLYLIARRRGLDSWSG